LNLIINLSELWEEDAAEQFLEAYAEDMQLIGREGRRCLQIVERLVASQSTDVPGGATEASGGAAGMPGNGTGKSEDAASAGTAISGGVPTADELLRQTIAKLVASPPPVNTTAEVGRILVVDDIPSNCDIIRRRLERDGHSVTVATGGREALDLVQRMPFDLVLLDMVMPDVNGVEVLARLKADPATRDLPVIMISAFDEVDLVGRCIEYGAEDYIPKPLDKTLLRARITACLEKHRLRLREIEHLETIDRERQRADDLLHDILPGKLVRELKATKTVAPRGYDRVAVLFADIQNFTPYCERHTPEHVVEQLRGLVESWEDSAVRHSVQKIKTIGDAFMAASGLLDPVENPVLACLRCGLEMIEATRALPTGWDLRVGIHCGHVIGGVIGRRQYLFDLWGDTVNTAARMESHGVPGRINLTADAWSLISECCAGSPREKLEVKGKSAVDMFLFDRFL
jgi:class 3 adenylate cyclase